MKILFLNATIPNYLVDGLFHGLKSMQGVSVVDVPRIDYMYADASDADLEKTGSRGNTLYKLLPETSDAKGNRTFWQRDMEDYDYIIFTDIFHQFDLYYAVYKSIHPDKRRSLCIIDGYDVTAKFPYFNHHYNLRVRPWSYFLGTGQVAYFKREYVNPGETYGVYEGRFPLLNKVLSAVLRPPSKLLPISMSIPEQHIEYHSLSGRTQEFVNYNIDAELDEIFPRRAVAQLGKWQPAFENQEEYFNDIKRSKFGITGRRAGWDCLRHYEYAAKGAILCFKHLDKKNPLCAPFDLNDSNCIAYSDKDDLKRKIKKSSMELESIQANQYEWIRKYTTRNVAARFLEKLDAMRK